MARPSTFGQWPFYGIIAMAILFLSQARFQAVANGVGLHEFASAYDAFYQKMAIFKQRTPVTVIQADEDPAAGMLKIVRKNLDVIRKILLASFEPIRGVVVRRGIDTDEYRLRIHKLTKAPDNMEVLLIYRYFKIYNFLDGIPNILEHLVNEKTANGNDKHSPTVKLVANQLRHDVNEFIPKVRLEFDLFGKFKNSRNTELYLDKLSTAVYDGIPTPPNLHGQIVAVAKNAAPLISAKFAEHQKRLRELTSEPCKAMDTLFARDGARRGHQEMKWMKDLLEDVLNLKEKVTLFLVNSMSDSLDRMADDDVKVNLYWDISMSKPQYTIDKPDRAIGYEEMALHGLLLKVLRQVHVENRKFFQLLPREFAAQISDNTMQMSLFNEPKYQVHRDFMFLLYAAKVLVSEVVLPEIVHIFGTAARKPLHQQGQQHSRAQRVRTLALVNMIVGPKLKSLAHWELEYRHKSQDMNLQYPNARYLKSIYGYAEYAFDTFQWLEKEFNEHDNTEPTDEEYKLAEDQLVAQINDGLKSQKAEFVGEHIFQEWGNNRKKQSDAAAKETSLAAIDEQDELMADGMDANPANLHKRKAMEIDGAEDQAGSSSSHVAGDKMKKI